MLSPRGSTPIDGSTCTLGRLGCHYTFSRLPPPGLSPICKVQCCNFAHAKRLESLISNTLKIYCGTHEAFMAELLYRYHTKIVPSYYNSAINASWVCTAESRLETIAVKDFG